MLFSFFIFRTLPRSFWAGREKPRAEASGGTHCMELGGGKEGDLGLGPQQSRAHSWTAGLSGGTGDAEVQSNCPVLGPLLLSVCIHSLSSQFSSQVSPTSYLFTDDSQDFPPARTFSPLYSRHEYSTQHLHLDV